MFWAVQGMAAELSTGTLVMNEISKSDKKISMLVVSNSASFHKKARGKIQFICTANQLVKDAVAKAIETGLPQTFHLESKGLDESNDMVSLFTFEWSVKIK